MSTSISVTVSAQTNGLEHPIEQEMQVGMTGSIRQISRAADDQPSRQG